MKQLDREQVREVTENIKKILDRLQKSGPNGKIQFQPLTDAKFDQCYYELNKQRDVLRGLIENSQDLERTQVSFTSPPKQKIDQKYIQVRYIHFAINHFPIIDSTPSMLCGAVQPSPDFTPPFGQIVVTKYEGTPILAMVGVKHSPNVYQMFFVAKFKGHFYSPAHNISFFPVYYPSFHSDDVEHSIGTQVYFVINTESKETAELKQGIIQARPTEHNFQTYTVADNDGNTFDVKSRFVAPISSPYEYNEDLEKLASTLKRPVIKPVKPPKPIQSYVPKQKPTVEHVKHPKIKTITNEPPKPKARPPKKLTEAQKVAHAIHQASESHITSFNFLSLNRTDDMETYGLSHPVIYRTEEENQNSEKTDEVSQEQKTESKSEFEHTEKPEPEPTLLQTKDVVHRVEVKSCVAVTPVVINKLVKPKDLQHAPRDSSAEDIFSLLNNHDVPVIRPSSAVRFPSQYPSTERIKTATSMSNKDEEQINKIPSIEDMINPVKAVNHKIEARSTIMRSDKNIQEGPINEQEKPTDTSLILNSNGDMKNGGILTNETNEKSNQLDIMTKVNQNTQKIDSNTGSATNPETSAFPNEDSKPELHIHTPRNPGSLKIQLKLSKGTSGQ